MAKIVFMGTPEFALPSLEALYQAGHELSLIVCQPDKKKGRGQKIQCPPVKKWAQKNQIEVLQPFSLKDQNIIDQLEKQQADFFIVIAYGKILPANILNLPSKACINLHASLLPIWRGAAPIQFALLNGDSMTGVTTMLMDQQMDTGDILLQENLHIQPDENIANLSARLAQLGSQLIIKTITQFDQITPQPQNHTKATYTRFLHPIDRLIDWEKTSTQIFYQYQTFTPEPGLYTFFRQKRLTILKVQNNLNSFPEPPGTILIPPDKKYFTVVCSQGALDIFLCQPESKKPISTQDFINGYQLQNGELLGNKKNN